MKSEAREDVSICYLAMDSAADVNADGNCIEMNGPEQNPEHNKPINLVVSLVKGPGQRNCKEPKAKGLAKVTTLEYTHPQRALKSSF